MMLPYDDSEELPPDDKSLTGPELVHQFDNALKRNGSDRALYSVITISECARMFHKQRNSILMAIYTGRLIARCAEHKSRGTWIIDYRSAVALWGK